MSLNEGERDESIISTSKQVPCQLKINSITVQNNRTYHPRIMTIRNSLQQNLTHTPCLTLIIKTLLHNPVKQLPSSHSLHNQTIFLGFLKEIIQTNDMGSRLERKEDFNFVEQGGGIFFVQNCFINDFNSVGIGRGGFVCAQFDLGEGSFAELWRGWQ